MFQKKTWTDREVEKPGSRIITFTDGSREPVTICRNEGTILKEGDALNASSFNDLEDRIGAAFENLDINEVLDAHIADKNTHVTAAEKEKIDSIPSDFSVIQTQSDWNEDDSESDAYIKNKPSSLPASDVYDWAKQPDKPDYTASEVGADAIGSAAASLSSAKEYADERISGFDSHISNEYVHVTAKEKEKLEEIVLKEIALKEDLLKTVYPVGSIYMSVNAANPGTLFGGTWVAWGTGRVPVGINTADTNFNAIEKTGGSSSISLTTANLPSHNHGLNGHTHSIPSLSGSAAASGSHTHVLGITSKENAAGKDHYRPISYTAGGSTGYESSPAGGHTHNVTTTASATGGNSGSTTSTGSGTAHTNLQPYITCYMWKRTA